MSNGNFSYIITKGQSFYAGHKFGPHASWTKNIFSDSLVIISSCESERAQSIADSFGGEVKKININREIIP